MIDSTSKMKGCISIQVYDKDGTLKDSRQITNKIVMTGCELIASLLANDGTIAAPTHVAVGGSDQHEPEDVTITDVKLTDEIVRIPFDGPATREGNSVTFEATFKPGVPEMENTPIKEVAIFNSETVEGSVMLNRAKFAVINKAYEDTVVVNWIVTILSDGEN